MLAKGKKIFAVLFLLFVIIFVMRFILGFFIDFQRLSEDLLVNAKYEYDAEFSYRPSQVNYKKAISSNQELDRSEAIDAKLIQSLEALAKEAVIECGTLKMDSDEQNIRAAIKEHKATISLEKQSGRAPRRALNLIIKVPNDHFDALVKCLKETASLKKFDVTVEDRTEDARKLYVTIESLRKHKEALSKLRSQQGKVEELIKLEDRIQEIEKQLQELSVSMADYTTGASVANINFNMSEEQPPQIDKAVYPIVSRIIDSFIWTVGWYSLIVMAAAMVWISLWSIRTLTARSSV